MRRISSIAALAFSLACLMPIPVALAVEDAQVAPVPPGPPPPPRFRGMHRIGLGANYWKTIDNIDLSNVNSDGFSYIISYQYAPVWFVKIGTNLEYFPSLGTESQPFLAPELVVTVGGLVYGGAGIGIYYHDSDWGSAPFYMLRAGLDIPIAPRFFVDLNVNYRFNDWDTLDLSEDLATDTLQLGAAIRFAL